MSEEKNIENRAEDPACRQAGGKSEKPEEFISSETQPFNKTEPVSTDEVPQTINLPTGQAGDKPETSDMEVHHHTHHGHERKNWKSYFWEFLMLFLAVVCGFLAENQREHYIESQREKKYAAQLLADLKKDTSEYNRINERLKGSITYYDSARRWFQQQPILNDDEFARLSRNLYVSYNIVTVSTTFNQMKNSGSLRYIGNTSLGAALSDYYDQQVPRLLTFMEYLNVKLHEQIEPFFAEHFDLNVSRFYYSYDTLPAKLTYFDRSVKSDLIIKNYFQLYFNGAFYIMEEPLKAANHKALSLIKELQNEYHLE